MKIVVKEKPYAKQIEFLDRHLLSRRTYPRKKLVEILSRYNESIGNDAPALEQIKTLSDANTVCIVTGQQLGLAGGPAYTILKAITCLLLAKEMNAVPIFWLATEDHDVVEIDQAYLLDSLGDIQKYSAGLVKDGYSVEDLELTQKNWEAISKLCSTLDLSDLPKDNSSYSHAMASFLAKQFAGTGLVFLEPHLLRPLAVPFFQREIEASDRILEILRDTTQRVGSAVIPFNSGTNLFMKNDRGLRRKIRREGEWFLVDHDSYSEAELKAVIKDQPERFSPNVAARPLLQSLLLPVLAYVAGPSEEAYFQQLVDYFHFYDIPMPAIVPRLSATIIPSFAREYLEKCQLEPWNPLPHHWIEMLPETAEAGETLKGEWQQSILNHFQEDLASDMLQRYVKAAVRKVVRKACRARIRKKGIPSHALHYLRNLLHPHDKPQDRVLNWWGFQSHTRENLIQAFLNTAAWNAGGQLYCFLDE